MPRLRVWGRNSGSNATNHDCVGLISAYYVKKQLESYQGCISRIKELNDFGIVSDRQGSTPGSEELDPDPYPPKPLPLVGGPGHGRLFAQSCVVSQNIAFGICFQVNLSLLTTFYMINVY